MRQVEFAFLGCYYATYLVWRPRDERESLYISEPFLYDSEHPASTTLGAVSWLQHLALKAYKAGLRHAPYQPPAPAALPGREGGRKRGGGGAGAGREGGGRGVFRHEGSGATGRRGEEGEGEGDDTLQGGGGGGGRAWQQSGSGAGEAACLAATLPPALCPPKDVIERGSFLGEGESGLVYAGLLNGSKAALKVGGAAASLPALALPPCTSLSPPPPRA